MATEGNGVTAKNLRAALGRWGGGVMRFQEEVAATGVAGHTYPAIKRYLDGEVSPSLEFCGAAAAILGVDPAWLAFGSDEIRPPRCATCGQILP